MKRFLPTLIFLAAAAFAGTAQTHTVTLGNGQKMTVDFYGPDIVRLFLDPAGGEVRDPEANPPAKILVDNPRREAHTSVKELKADKGTCITSDAIKVFVMNDGSVSVISYTNYAGSTMNDRTIVKLSAPEFGPTGTTVTLSGSSEADYYGGGIQNGRYRHTGKTIAIENQNSWTDGGVCSPAPFFWSTDGYGILWHTFAPGTYTFGKEEVTLSHETPYLDLFIMAGKSDAPHTFNKVIDNYFQLTGAPVLLPKFGFYEGHLNAYNRDWWKETSEGGIPFEDGKRYVESQKEIEGGIHESLNGELPGNYQFSARAVVDRYEAADMPLGWILPNDGYGAGYGQTETLDGNVANLRAFGEYARSKGVEIGLWTQSDQHPVDSLPALLQRDIVREVRDAGVRVLKTDVAWVGRGYSFGLNGIADAASIMTEYGYGARPFIITVDGWAGTQRYAGVWSGDQKGGEWEYIRFHIPTYICAGLSGQPNITSDMDGIFGGANETINIRDFEWKAFTPMQLNMDGWGLNEKYPMALGSRAADINRRYLKLKSELMPYAYSIAHEAVTGLPMIRAIELEDATAKAVPTSKYQFLYGPSLLVAPIYQNTEADADGNDIRNGIYLPEGLWLDWFGSEAYLGGRVLCGYEAPLDKLPVLMRSGAIIPLTRPHNNPSQLDKGIRIYDIFPSFRGSTFVEYDDNGRTLAYLDGACATTEIGCRGDGKDVIVEIAPTKGSFDGFEPVKSTELRIRTAGMPKKIVARIGGKKVKVNSTYDPSLAMLTIQLLSCNTSVHAVDVTLKDFKHIHATVSPRPEPELTTFCLNNPAPEKLPSTPKLLDPVVSPDKIDLRWEPVPGADHYSVMFGGILYDNIKGEHLLFEDLQPDTKYDFTVRSLDKGWPSFPVETSVTTAPDPLRWAVSDIQAHCSVESYPGQDLKYFFDLQTEDSNIWHTLWSIRAVPFTLDLDLLAVYTIDKMEYYPRNDAGNGTILAGTVSWSADGKTWTEPAAFSWTRDPSAKSFDFGGAQVRFVRIDVTNATGDFGSGRELLLYRVPGTGSYRGGVFNEKGEAVESL